MIKNINKILFILCLISLTASHPAGAADDTFECLNTFNGPTVPFTGDQGYANNDYFYTVDGTRFDARDATWFQETTPAVINDYPIDVRMIDENTSVCWAGGLIHNTNPLDIGWTESYVTNNAAFISMGGQMTVDGTRFYNAFDGFRPWQRDVPFNGPFILKNVWMTYMRDDCIENDSFNSGLVDDSLFDGCFVFLSARNGGITDVSNMTVTVQNSLIRLQQMPDPPGYEGTGLKGHGNLFKYQTGSPRHALHNNIFLIEGIEGITRYGIDSWLNNAPAVLGFKVAEGKLESCSNNTIVWLGDGDNDGDYTDDDFPGDIPNDPSCVTVTRDRSVWDNARAKWINDHPQVMRIQGVDDVNPPTNLPPSVSAISHNATDADLNRTGLQVQEGVTVIYHATASDPDNDLISWQWIYTIDGGAEIPYSGGIGVVSDINFLYGIGTAGKTYVWILRASDGQVTTESRLTVEVIDNSPQPPPSSGPVLHLPLDGTLNDSAGNNHGTFFGGTPNYATGQISQGLDFNTDYVSIPAPGTTLTFNAFTLSTWVKFDNLFDGINTRLIKHGEYAKGGDPVTDTIEIWKGKSGSTLYCSVRGSISWASSRVSNTWQSANMSSGNWHHITCTYDRNSIQIFIDGTEVDYITKAELETLV